MSSLQHLNKQLRLTTVVITCVLMAGLLLPTNLSLLFIEEATAGTGGPVPRYGKVMTRGIVRTAAGNPIWAEIGVDGLVVADINEVVGEYKDAKAYSVLSYLSIVQAFNNFKNQHKDGIAKGAVVLTRAEYEQKQFLNVEVPKLNVAQDDPNKTESVPITKLQLRDTTKTVYIRSQESVIDPRLLPTKGPQRGMILFEAPIDLRQSELKTEFSSNIKSLLLSYNGSILKESTHNIGFKTHLYKTDAAGNVTNEALGPVVAAHIDAGIYSLNYSTLSGEDGKYNLTIFIPPCPGFSFAHDYNIWAKIFYTNFDPEAPSALGFYYYKADDFYMCSNFSAAFGGLSAMTGLALSSIENSIGDGLYENNFYIDLLKFTGVGFLSNEGSPLPFGETQYEYTAPPLDKVSPQKLDLNLDRVSDYAELNSTDNRYYNVYLDGQTTNADGTAKEADLKRVADVAPDFTDQGLLKSISIADMMETDVYIYRVSNGKIVVKQKGLRERAIRKNGYGYAFNLTLPGPLDDLSDGLFTTLAQIEQFQEAAGYPEEMRGRKADFLRPGEEVKIIAINRPTGYIGSINTTVHTPIDGSYTVIIDQLVMQPPNLKVKVERMYSVEAGLSKYDDKKGKRKYTVGFEGTALTTDTAIEISTQWFDYDGTPLPDELEGYTGRLAKVTGNNSLSGGDVNKFKIEPGSRLQVLTFAGDILGSEHFYIHVSGYPEWRNPGIGAGDGPLTFRPKNYVPIKTPILDEVATRQLRDFNAYNKQDQVAGTLDEVEAVYQWPYRPEMQFSVFDLKVKNLKITDIHGQEKLLDVTGDPQLNLMSLLLSQDTVSADLLYDLFAQDNPQLPTFGAGQKLVFALGAEETYANLTPGGTVQFVDTSHIANLTSEDYLSIRLYSNNDTENILWEWAFGAIAMAVDFNRDGKVGLKAVQVPNSNPDLPPVTITDKTSIEKPFRFWLNNDYDVVIQTAFPDASIKRCPPQTGSLQICEQDDDTFSIEQGLVNSLTRKIESERDLEDFAPLALSLGGYAYDGFDFDKYELHIQANGFSMNLYQGEWVDGDEYTWNTVIAQKQAEAKFIMELLDGADTQITPPDYIKMNFDSEGIAKLIFEGVSGNNICVTDQKSCYLGLSVIDKATSQEVASTKVYMDLHDIKDFYQHNTSGQGIEKPPVPAYPIPVPGTAVDIFPKDNPNDKLDYILMVHGWRMPYAERVIFAETTLKRLYWSGYKGKFGTFSWPTTYFVKPAYLDTLATLGALTKDLTNYSRGEKIARQTGKHLADLLPKIKTDYNTNSLQVIAHSMGNVVVSEALKLTQAGIVDIYIATQSATSAGAYNFTETNMNVVFGGDADDKVATDNFWNWIAGEICLPFVNISFDAAWRCASVVEDGLIDSPYDIPPDHYRYTFTDTYNHGLPPKSNGIGIEDETYYAGIGAKTTIHNFYNAFDSALGGWRLQQVTKPDSGSTISTASNPNTGWFYVANSNARDNYESCMTAAADDPEAKQLCENNKLDFGPVRDFYGKNGSELLWLNETDKFEIMASIIPSRTGPLGQRPVCNTGEIKNDNCVNLQDAEYDFTKSNYDHSAQWLNTYHKRYKYWQKVCTTFFGTKNTCLKR